MNNKIKRPIYSLGMFDFLKGISLFLTIAGHTMYHVPWTEKYLFSITVGTTIGNFLLYGFIIAAGFGIHKLSVKKCLAKIKKTFLKPYIITGVLASLLYAFNKFLLSSDFRFSAWEFFRSILGFAVGQHPIQLYGSFQMLNVGPAWFFVSLAGAWFIFNLILLHTKGWKRNLAVFITAMIGYFGNLHASPHGIAIPFCFFFMFEYVLGLYIGYLARENDLIKKSLSPLAILLIIGSLLGFAWKYYIPYEISSLTIYPLGIITPFAAGAVGFGVLYLMTHISRRESPFITFFEKIGKESYYIIWVHTIEYIGIPWYIFRDNFGITSSLYIFLIIFILRSIFIVIGIVIIKKYKKYKISNI